jgi:DNA-binding MarR family transcriptional regulator
MQETRTVEGRSSPTTHVVDSVLHTAMSIGRLMRQRVVGDQLEPAAYWVLKHLDRGSMRITELAGSTQLDTSTASRHVTQLERTGLVERSQDPDDGRAQRVGLTDEGRQQLHASIARRRQALEESFADWDPADMADLDRLLSRLVTDIETRAQGERTPAHRTTPDDSATTSSAAPTEERP